MIVTPSALKTQEQDVLIALKCLPPQGITPVSSLSKNKARKTVAYLVAGAVFVLVSALAVWLLGNALMAHPSILVFFDKTSLFSAVVGLALTVLFATLVLGVTVVVYSVVFSHLPNKSQAQVYETKDRDRARDLMFQALPTLENDDLRNEILKAMPRLEDRCIEDKFWKEVSHSLEGYFKIKTNNYGLGFLHNR